MTGTWPDGSRPGWLLRSKQLKKSSGRRKVIRAKHGTGKAGTGVTTAPVIQYCLEHGPKIRRWRRRRRPPPATNEKNKNKNNKINRKERPPDRSVRNRHPIAVRRANSRPQRPGKNGVRPAGRGRRPMGGSLRAVGSGRWAKKCGGKKEGFRGGVVCRPTAGKRDPPPLLIKKNLHVVASRCVLRMGCIVPRYLGYECTHLSTLVVRQVIEGLHIIFQSWHASDSGFSRSNQCARRRIEIPPGLAARAEKLRAANLLLLHIGNVSRLREP